MITAADLRGVGAIPRISWREHAQWLDGHLAMGEHVSIFAPTGKGKTYLIRHHLPFYLRTRVLAILSKPKDDTPFPLMKKVGEFPSRVVRYKYELRRPNSQDWLRDPEWFALKPPGYRYSLNKVEMARRIQRARDVVGVAMDKTFHEGDWVVIADETRSLADAEPPGLGLARDLRRIWQQGRSNHVTLIAATQAPRYVPGEMYDQPTHLYFGRARDARVYDRLSEIAGEIDLDLIRRTLPTLRLYEFLYTYTGIDERTVIVRAPS